jgi:hypothetical protein
MELTAVEEANIKLVEVFLEGSNDPDLDIGAHLEKYFAPNVRVQWTDADDYPVVLGIPAALELVYVGFPPGDASRRRSLTSSHTGLSS